MKEARFEIKELLGVGFTLLVLAIGMAYGLEVMTDIEDDMGVSGCSARSDTHTSYNSSANQCYNSSGDHVGVDTAPFNATGAGITGVAKIPSKIPTIATVVLASMIIGILVTYLWARFAS